MTIKALFVIGNLDVGGAERHLGQMWKALANVAPLVKAEGELYIAIYNNQGRATRWWSVVKKIYCSGLVGRALMKLTFYLYFGVGQAVQDIIRLRNPLAQRICL